MTLYFVLVCPFLVPPLTAIVISVALFIAKTITTPVDILMGNSFKNWLKVSNYRKFKRCGTDLYIYTGTLFLLTAVDNDFPSSRLTY